MDTNQFNIHIRAAYYKPLTIQPCHVCGGNKYTVTCGYNGDDDSMRVEMMTCRKCGLDSSFPENIPDLNKAVMVNLGEPDA